MVIFLLQNARARVCVLGAEGGWRTRTDALALPEPKHSRSAAPESGVLSVNGGRRPLSSRVPPARGSGAPGDPGRAGGSGTGSGERARAVGGPGPHRPGAVSGARGRAGCF